MAPTSAAERQKKRREKLKQEGKYDEFREKHRLQMQEYRKLWKKKAKKTSLKQLKTISQQQFFNATESSNNSDEELNQIKRQFAEINLLAMSADNIIDSVISEKFQSTFLRTFKDEVLKIILKLSSDQEKSGQEKSRNGHHIPTAEKTTKEKTEDARNTLDKKKDKNRYSAGNRGNVSKQIDIPSKETDETAEQIQLVLSTIKKEQDEEPEDSNLSFDSISSVHTSDLSSFDDAISISSDEERGKKGKRISLKMAQEEIRAKKLKSESTKQEQSIEIKSEYVESPDDSANTQQKSLPQRVRKPNSKYNEYDVLSPLKIKVTEKSCLEKPTPNRNPTFLPENSDSVSRKRGRPRKYQQLHA